MNAPRPPGLRILILAAGFSRRLGQPKALARIHGSSLLRRTLQATASLTSRPVIIVVPRYHAHYAFAARGFAAEFVVNANSHRGLSSSIVRGVESARYASGVLLLPVDLAHLKRRELAALISRWCARPRAIAARRIQNDDRRSRPAAPLILPHWLFGLALHTAADEGLRQVIDAAPRLPCVLVDMPSATCDIDFAADLQAARRRRGLRLDQGHFFQLCKTPADKC